MQLLCWNANREVDGCHSDRGTYTISMMFKTCQRGRGGSKVRK